MRFNVFYFFITRLKTNRSVNFVLKNFFSKKGVFKEKNRGFERFFDFFPRPAGGVLFGPPRGEVDPPQGGDPPTTLCPCIFSLTTEYILCLLNLPNEKY